MGTLQLVTYLQPHNLRIQPSRCRTVRALLGMETMATTLLLVLSEILMTPLYVMYSIPLLMTTAVLCRTGLHQVITVTVHYAELL